MKYFLLFLCSVSITTYSVSQNLSAIEILNKSIAYHNPNNNWNQWSGTLCFTELRESGERFTTFSFDNTKGRFVYKRDSTSHGMQMDSCFVLSGDASCEQITTIRNYYLYLWGLPMKLKDSGTPLQNTVQVINDWQGEKVYAIEVHYEKENWTFFISQTNYALRGYQFYFNHKTGGELILLEDMLEYGGIKFPRNRTWYSLPENEYLAKDVLDRIK